MKLVSGMANKGRWLVFCLALSFPGIATAHSFNTPYDLPVPFWMYAYGCVATLVVTFAVLGYFYRTSKFEQPAGGPALGQSRIIGRIGARGVTTLRAGAGALLILAIIAGLGGGGNSQQNIAMPLFWVIFLLGTAYVTALFGNFYPIINPWRLVIDGLERLGIDCSRNRVELPAVFAGWFALLTYAALVWIELFAGPAPANVTLILVAHSLLTISGTFLFGKRAWFSQYDIFERLFRLTGKIAPLAYLDVAEDARRWGIRLRQPLSGAEQGHPTNIGGVLFILFMLSSTTYDGLHETIWWARAFWTNALVVFQPLWGGDLVQAQDMLMGWYRLYQWGGLIIFPFFYLAIYVASLGLAKVMAASEVPLKQLIRQFALSILPIAIAYNFTHYFAMFAAEMENLPCVLSDPLDMGWRLLSTANCPVPSSIPMVFVWHLQVAVLLLGHVAGVYLSHAQARRIFPAGHRVMLSQIPMLATMVFYTVFGLWILTLPLGPIG